MCSLNFWALAPFIRFGIAAQCWDKVVRGMTMESYELARAAWCPQQAPTHGFTVEDCMSALENIINQCWEMGGGTENIPQGAFVMDILTISFQTSNIDPIEFALPTNPDDFCVKDMGNFNLKEEDYQNARNQYCGGNKGEYHSPNQGAGISVAVSGDGANCWIVLDTIANKCSDRGGGLINVGDEIYAMWGFSTSAANNAVVAESTTTAENIVLEATPAVENAVVNIAEGGHTESTEPTTTYLFEWEQTPAVEHAAVNVAQGEHDEPKSTTTSQFEWEPTPIVEHAAVNLAEGEPTEPAEPSSPNENAEVTQTAEPTESSW
ncbi:hypothetical protein BGZ63DRAFT_462005 [Mariannaea sp. PMI_226]|nr:hypothetical protein BGZ63DRAFT_462005 [Mariannaea sp. PMI_226]